MSKASGLTTIRLQSIIVISIRGIVHIITPCAPAPLLLLVPLAPFPGELLDKRTKVCQGDGSSHTGQVCRVKTGARYTGNVLVDCRQCVRVLDQVTGANCRQVVGARGPLRILHETGAEGGGRLTIFFGSIHQLHTRLGCKITSHSFTPVQFLC